MSTTADRMAAVICKASCGYDWNHLNESGRRRYRDIALAVLTVQYKERTAKRDEAMAAGKPWWLI